MASSSGHQVHQALPCSDKGIPPHRYAQLKLALEEKDGALAEALDLLEQTQQAQQLQEQALDELRQQLAKYTAEITQAQEAMRKRDIALKLKEESDRIATTAVQSSQLCRQEAAAALQQKDVQMMQVCEGPSPMMSTLSTRRGTRGGEARSQLDGEKSQGGAWQSIGSGKEGYKVWGVRKG